MAFAAAEPKMILCQIGAARFTIAAEIVLRGVKAPDIVHLPWLSDALAGLLVIENQVVPVIDPRAALASGAADALAGGLQPGTTPCDEAHEAIVVAVGGRPYAVLIDRVIAVGGQDGCAEASDGAASAEAEFDGAVRALDIDAVIATLRDTIGEPGLPDDLVPVASLPHDLPRRSPKRADPPLLVETELGSHLIARDSVLHAFDALPVTLVPDPNPLLAGAVLYLGGWIPVVRLDRLLGEEAISQAALGGYVVVECQGEPVAVGVKRVVGASAEVGIGQCIDLAARLARALPRSSIDERDDPPALPSASEDSEYLLLELGAQRCAVSVDVVAGVHASCEVVHAPPSAILGLAGIAVVAGRAMPLLDAARLLGVSDPAGVTTGYVVLGRSQRDRFVVPVASVGRVISIADRACAPAPDDAAISAFADVGDQTLWILSAEALIRRSGWNSDAA